MPRGKADKVNRNLDYNTEQPVTWPVREEVEGRGIGDAWRWAPEEDQPSEEGGADEDDESDGQNGADEP